MQFIEYPGFGPQPGRCAIRIHRLGNEVIVLITELADNPGTSTFNVIEHLVTQLHTQLGFDRDQKVRWIQSVLLRPDIWMINEVMLDHDDTPKGRIFSQPVWRRLSEEETAEMVDALTS